MRRSPLALTLLLAACVADTPQDPLSPTATTSAVRAAVIAPTWQLIDYGTGGQSAVLSAVNASGTAVGLRYEGENTIPVMTVRGKLVDIALPRRAINGSADDINDAGDIVGAYRIGYTRYAYHRSAAGVMTALPALPGETWQRAWAINNAGQIVGNAADHNHAVLWTPVRKGTWKVADLGEIDPGSFSDAREINDAGWIVGVAESGGLLHGFLKKPGRAMQDIGTLGGHGGTSSASGINNLGAVVGVSSTVSGTSATFQWTSAGGMVNLTSSHALAWPSVNDHGRVAGNHVVSSFYVKAFTLKAGIFQYLPPRVLGEVAGANRISSCGRIAGFSGLHAVVWRPVVGTPPVPICD